MKMLSVAAAVGLLASPIIASASGASFLEINPSARAYALGRSNTVASLGAQAFGANPANLGLLPQRFEAFTSFATLLDGTKYGHMAAAMSSELLPGVDSLGLAVTRLQSGGFQTADAVGNKTGDTFEASDLAVSLGASGHSGPNLRLGGALKAIQSKLAGYKSGTSLAGDLGATYTFPGLSKPLSVGLSVTNFGQGVKFIDQTDALPTALNIGVAAPVSRVLLVAELKHLVADKATQLGMGAELNMGPVAFRGGMQIQNESQNLARGSQSGAGKLLGGLSAGVGLKLGSVNFDYAVSQQAVEYGATQRVSLSLRWGNAAKGSSSPQPQTASVDRSDWMVHSMGDY